MTTIMMNNNKALEVLLADAKRSGQKRVIKYVPVDMFAIDTAYQTPVRTERDIKYLTGYKIVDGENGEKVKVPLWDERKLLPLVGVPHWEEGKIYIVDGFARWMGSQIVDAKKYTELEVMIIMNAPDDPKERQKFEAELYATQEVQHKAVTPLQKHGALLVLGDETAIALDELKEEYGFEFSRKRGARSNGVIGSYTELYNRVKSQGKEFGKFFFDTMIRAGFDRKTDGYGVYIMRAIADIYKLYPADRESIKAYLGSRLRETDYRHINGDATNAYPLLGASNAFTMYIEDLVVDGLGIDHVRKVVNDKIVAA